MAAGRRSAGTWPRCKGSPALKLSSSGLPRGRGPASLAQAPLQVPGLLEKGHAAIFGQVTNGRQWSPRCRGGRTAFQAFLLSGGSLGGTLLKPRQVLGRATAPGAAAISQGQQLFPSQVLLPFMPSQEVARRQRAVGRVVHLSQLWMSSLMLEAVPFRKGNFFLFKEKPVQFLGQLMGHVTLSCAEEDQEISCAAAEALGALHSFVLLRQGCQAAREDRELPTERESASTFWPKEPADETTVFGSFLLPKERSDFLLTVLRNMVHPRVSDTQTVANVLEVVLRHSCSELTEVEEITQAIHVQLAHLSQKPLQDILRTTLVQVAHLNPWKVTAGLLRASPYCDSTARAMWRILASEPCLADSVLRRLLLLQEDAIQHDYTDECSRYHFLAVASAMHEIFLVPSSQVCVRVLVDELFMAVVLQMSFSLKSPGWGCCTIDSHSREANLPPVRPIRSVVSTMQALFHCLSSTSLAEDIGRQGAWDALLSPETYPTGIAVLTRVLRREAPACCASLFAQALRGLRVYQDIGTMAVFVELLDDNDFERVDGATLYVLRFHLRSESLVLRRMAVTSLATLSGRPEKAATLQGLLPEVTQRLQDDDCSIRTAALTVLRNTLCLVDRQTAVPIALQLLMVLLPLFENESSFVREHSILLHRDAVDVAVGTHAKQMRKEVRRSLMPLFFHLHDEDHSVAQASREALLGAAKLLKRRQLRKLLETEQTWRVAERLLAENSSRVEEYLDQSLPYLQSPQEPLREAAVKFLGLAGQRLRDGHQEKLQVIYEALQGKANDSSPSVSSLALETLRTLGTAVEEPPSGFSLQALRYRLQRAWRRTTRALGDGWLCCRSCVQG
ncbi:maestro heat-like repeat-containing protein family member 7 [Haliaeetus albicilla]|uniref:maestro heat-like repeat-containing protein family member 7 n=1 Tax=Haliaeetus albicilla TaxID=8969 RepID=UPI0037E92CB4